MRAWRLLAVLVTLLIPGAFSFAQTESCGTITGPVFSDSYRDTIVVVAYENCADPFQATTPEESPFTFSIKGNQIEQGETVTVESGGTDDYSFMKRFFDPIEDAVRSAEPFLYKKTGNDYTFINTPSVPVESDYRQLAEEFFSDGVDFEQYITAIMYREGTYVFATEEEDGLFYDYQEYVRENFVPVFPKLTAGEYTLVWPEFIFGLSYRPSWKRLLDVFIQTAYAQSNPPTNIFVTPFTVEEEVVTPAGASSVLFLPGIQASRLYKDGLLGTEDQLWEPNFDQDVRQLALTTSGSSINDIYTRDVVDEVVLPKIGGNIYKGFLSYLGDLKSTNLIKDFRPFAYDWRFSVTDIVFSGTRYKNEIKGVIDELEDLAESSFSGKVTIVAHSNGGLLAKAMIIELERLGKEDLVDNVIFIGTPHLGTPKALGTILHGYDQQKLGGAVIDDKTAREIINNMPGAYALLPSEKYVQISTKPVITFTDSSVTAAMRSRYGATIDSLTEYSDFLNGAEGRTSVYDNISAPYVTNQAILSDALASHRERLDNWVPPANISVHNIVGVGLKTVNALEYREFIERTECSTNFFGQTTCNDPERYIRPYAHFTQYGDETVTSLSAEGVAGKTYYFDFDEYDSNTISLGLESHADFTEIEQIQELVRDIVASTTDPIDYISAKRPTFTQEYTVTTIDSPVRLVATDSTGKRTGVIIVNGQAEVVKEIPGSEYIEFAGAKYLITPRSSIITTSLFGEAYGSYTLTTATLKENDTQVVDTRLSDATTTPQMEAQFTSQNGSSSSLKTDLNGDGTIDTETTLSGVVIQKPVVTFATLRQEIQSLKLAKLREAPLLLLVGVAEASAQKTTNRKLFVALARETLLSLSRLVAQYEKQRWISSAQSQALQNTITLLRATIK